MFVNNNATVTDGALMCHHSSRITLEGNSVIHFISNSALSGGAVHCQLQCAFTLIAMLI